MKGWNIFFGMVVLLLGCGSETGVHAPAEGFVVNHSDPRTVVEAIFVAAKGGNAALLEGLCDPNGQSALDVRRICDYAVGFDREGEFPMFFASGRVTGQVLVTSDQAWVPFYFGPNGDRLDTMELQRHQGKWYIERF